MVFFGNQAKGPFSEFLRMNVADRGGNLIKDEMIEAPFPSFAHDFFVTEKYVVFPVYPLVFSLERAISGGIPMAWEPERGAHFGVMPRDGNAADVTWHNMDPRWSFHMVNAWDEGDTIKVDVCASNATRFAPKLDGTMASADDGLSPVLRRWTIEVGGNTNSVGEELLDDMPCEFPRTDDRFMTRAHRHAWLVGGADAQLMFNRLVHFDRVTGTRKLWGDDRYLLGEPVFAPRSGSVTEGDGYVLNLAYDQSTALSELLIFVATDIERGPVARARLPLRIPAGFHGTWVGA
jgi:carotenoid cleavage dioxygenase